MQRKGKRGVGCFQSYNTSPFGGIVRSRCLEVPANFFFWSFWAITRFLFMNTESSFILEVLLPLSPPMIIIPFGYESRIIPAFSTPPRPHPPFKWHIRWRNQMRFSVFSATNQFLVRALVSLPPLLHQCRSALGTKLVPLWALSLQHRLLGIAFRFMILSDVGRFRFDGCFVSYKLKPLHI